MGMAAGGIHADCEVINPMALNCSRIAFYAKHRLLFATCSPSGRSAVNML